MTSEHANAMGIAGQTQVYELHFDSLSCDGSTTAGGSRVRSRSPARITNATAREICERMLSGVSEVGDIAADIWRALMAHPQLLLLDEPSLGLAPLIVRKIFQIIREINQQGTTIFLVEQNAHMALTLAHRGYVLQTGQVIKGDSAKNLLEDPDVRKAYLGG